MDRITIVGLGLIGGSMGLALKAAKLRNLEIMGFDLDRDAVNQAKKRGAVDVTENTLEKALQNSRLVIVATPLLTYPEVFEAMAPHLEEAAVVTDVGSTKAQVMEWALQGLPSHIDFVGGHPLAGKETAGIAGATADLFQQAVYCICPTASSSPAAVDLIVGIVEHLGAKHLFVDAAEHDMLVGGISHLPLVLSAALVATASRSPSWKEMGKLAASGFTDTSRLASSSPDLSRGISLTNQPGLLRWIDGYIEVLQEYRQSLAEDPAIFADSLEEARVKRELWLVAKKSPQKTDAAGEPLPSTGELMQDMFVGGGISKWFRAHEERMKALEEGRRPARPDPPPTAKQP